MRERPRAIYCSIEATAIKSILYCPDCIRVFVHIEFLPMLLSSAVRDYVSNSQGGDNRFIDDLEGEDCNKEESFPRL